MKLRAFAIANHGRWIVRCPACPSAASLNGPGFDGKTFRCEECHAGPIPVEWPIDRAGIEQALHPRPIPMQNWEPGESVLQLRAENIDHGVK